MAEALTVVPADLLKLLAAFIVGGLIGAEREFHDKAAGLRTIILISVGACLFTIFSVKIAGDNDPGRIAAQIVTGVGFLGAGVILHREGQVRGLTTASTIWIAAALGVGCGVGYLLFILLAAIVVLFVLWVLPHVEVLLERARAYHTYRIVTALDAQKLLGLERTFKECGLATSLAQRIKREDALISVWRVAGKPREHEKAVGLLLADPEIREFEY